MSWGLALAGWAVAAWLLVRARRRRELVADAEHELRGALTAIGLALERVELGGYAALVAMQLERAAGALEDLAPGQGRRSGAARGAQLWANLIGNATEHGAGEVELRSARRGDVVRLEIENRNRRTPRAPTAAEPGRGRGLRIAARAAEELGGRLRADVGEAVTVATVELPAEVAAPGGRAAAETDAPRDFERAA